MGGISNLITSPQILDEIQRTHATMSPPAQQAADMAVGMKAPQVAAQAATPAPVAPVDGIKAPPVGNPAPMGRLAPVVDPPPASVDAAATAPSPLGISAPSARLPLGSSLGKVPDTAQEANLGRLTAPPPTDASMLHTRANTGASGIDQIHNPWGRIPLQILDAIGTGFAPRLTSAIPGTQLHHNAEVARAQGGVADERAQAAENRTAEEAPIKNAEAEARTEDLASKPELNEAKKERLTAQSQIGEEHQRGLEDIAKQKDEATLRTHGYKHDPESGEIVPLSYKEMSEEQQSVHDLKESQSEAAEAAAAFKKAQAANSPTLMALAQQRAENARKTSATAAARLGLSTEQFNMRAFGTVPAGGPPSGSVPAEGAIINPSGRSVGTAFQGNVKPTGAQRDAAGRAETMESLDSRIREALKDPEIANGVGPLAGRISEVQSRIGKLPENLAQLQQDLISYGAFQAGLHPVRGIGALQYFEKAMGGLHQTPEQLLGKLNSNLNTAKNVEHVGGMNTEGNGKSSSGAKPHKVYDEATGTFK